MRPAKTLCNVYTGFKNARKHLQRNARKLRSGLREFSKAFRSSISTLNEGLRLTMQG